jgi:hypothetical protein
MKSVRQATCVVLIAALVSPHAALAVEAGLTTAQEFSTAGAGSEYVSGNFPGAVLMPVNLWGSIGKPGIHHVPMRTDLVTLLSLAGGPGADAELDEVTIKRRSKGEEQILRVDAEKLLTKVGYHSPVLEANDIIIVPRSKPTISSNTAATVGFVGGLLSVILAGIALSAAVKK